MFASFFIFPKYSNDTRLYTFFIKEKIEEPFLYFGQNVNNFLDTFKKKNDLIKKNEELLKRNEFLQNVNNYLKLITSKYNDNINYFTMKIYLSLNLWCKSYR